MVIVIRELLLSSDITTTKRIQILLVVSIFVSIRVDIRKEAWQLRHEACDAHICNFYILRKLKVHNEY